MAYLAYFHGLLWSFDGLVRHEVRHGLLMAYSWLTLGGSKTCREIWLSKAWEYGLVRHGLLHGLLSGKVRHCPEDGLVRHD